MLTHTQEQFFVLLRAGLWDKPVDVNELLHPEAYQATESQKKTGSAPQTGTQKKTGSATQSAAGSATSSASPTATSNASPTATSNASPTATSNANPTATRSANLTATCSASPTATCSAKPTVDTEELGTDIDWKEIYKISREQTVTGLIADAIATLPAEAMPPLPVKQRFIMDKLAIERSHVQLNAVLNEVVNELNKHGIPHVLLKGQGVAQNYPHPTSRTCGDIDLYVGKENIHKACEVILANVPDAVDGPDEGEKGHHHHIDVGHVTLEIHRKADMMVNFFVDKKFQQWTKEQLDGNFSHSENLNLWDNNGTTIARAPYLFDSIFIMTHMLRHMFYEGVGLRQLCDWTMYIHKNHEKIRANELQTTLKSLGLTKAWNTFGTTAIHYLGLPESEIPLLKKRKANVATRVIRIMFETGNFGKFDKSRTNTEDKPKHYLSYKIKRFNYHFAYYFRVLPIFPKLMTLFILKWFKEGSANFIAGLKKK